jgi:hypothetical protein
MKEKAINKLEGLLTKTDIQSIATGRATIEVAEDVLAAAANLKAAADIFKDASKPLVEDVLSMRMAINTNLQEVGKALNAFRSDMEKNRNYINMLSESVERFNKAFAEFDDHRKSGRLASFVRAFTAYEGN